MSIFLIKQKKRPVPRIHAKPAAVLSTYSTFQSPQGGEGLSPKGKCAHTRPIVLKAVCGSGTLWVFRSITPPSSHRRRGGTQAGDHHLLSRKYGSARRCLADLYLFFCWYLPHFVSGTKRKRPCFSSAKARPFPVFPAVCNSHICTVVHSPLTLSSFACKAGYFLPQDES